MKYRVGQKVRAKPIEEMKKTGNDYDQYLLKKLEKLFCGKIFIITRITRGDIDDETGRERLYMQDSQSGIYLLDNEVVPVDGFISIDNDLFEM